MTMPLRRDLRFVLPAERVCDWHALGPYVTHFFNALSVTFPAGERYFIDSVRHYRDRIDDPVLKQQVLGFIGQEAMHTREHVAYNDALQAAGLPVAQMERMIVKLFDHGRRTLPHSIQLAQTVALEHYTAMLAGLLLDDGLRVADSVPAFAHIWTWHALEETEHKSVAFDVWNAVMKPGPKRYLIRALTMVQVTLMFWAIVFIVHLRLLTADRRRGGHLRGTWILMRFLFGRRGIFPNVALDWLRFFKPRFDPWDHDDRAHLSRIDALVAEMKPSEATSARHDAGPLPCSSAERSAST